MEKLIQLRADWEKFCFLNEVDPNVLTFDNWLQWEEAKEN